MQVAPQDIPSLGNWVLGEVLQEVLCTHIDIISLARAVERHDRRALSLEDILFVRLGTLGPMAPMDGHASETSDLDPKYSSGEELAELRSLPTVKQMDQEKQRYSLEAMLYSQPG